MKKFLYVFSITLFIGFFASCTEDDGAVYPTPSEFSASPTTANVDVAGGTVEIVINAGNLGWAIADPDAWFEISKQYGSGDATVILTIEPNTTESPRNGTIKIIPTFGKEPVSIAITQN